MNLSNQPEPATLVIHNAKVFTVDEAQPIASAVAVRGSEIVFVGDDEGSLEGLKRALDEWKAANPEMRWVLPNGKTRTGAGRRDFDP